MWLRQRQAQRYLYKVGNVRLYSQEIKSRLKSMNACYLSVQIIASSSSLRKNIKSKTYRITTLPIVFHGCETWSHTLRGKQKIRFFENGGPKKIFWPNINPENEMGRVCTTYEGKERRVKRCGGEA